MLSPRARWAAIQAGLILTAFGLLAWTVRGNWSQIESVLARRPDMRLFGLALTIYLAALVLTFIRWYFLVRALRLPFRLRDAIRLGFIGNVLNLVIPGAVGGDLIKAALLCREQEKRTQAVASMVIDRGVGLLGLFVLAAIGGIVEYPRARPEVRTLIQLAWLATVAGCVGLAVVLTPALFRPVSRHATNHPRLAAFVNELETLAASYRGHIAVIAASVAMAVAGHGLYVMAFALADWALYGADAPSLSRHFVIVPLVLFTTAVPLPFGALGLSEKASQSLFDLFAFPGGAVAMMGYRAVMYAGALISAMVYAANLQQIRRLRREALVSQTNAAR